MRKLTTDEFIQKSVLIHKNRFDYSKVIYKNNKSKVIILCPTHGKFEQIAESHLNRSGCPSCAQNKKLTLSDFVTEAHRIHKNKFNYNKVNYKSQKDKIAIICPVHGEFNQTPEHHLRGFGCSQCSGLKKLNSNEFITKSNIIHDRKYNYSNAHYINTRTKIEIICPRHGIFSQKPNDHLQGKGCPICNHIISISETQFLDYVHIPNTEENRQVRISKKQVDGLDLNTNTVYEFLGDYWHGNPSIYDPDKYNETCHKTHGELYQHTILRLDGLKQLGYNVKYIWENDWKRFECGIDETPKILEI